MADDELATRAPESDAHETTATTTETSPIPGDSKADQGAASLGV